MKTAEDITTEDINRALGSDGGGFYDDSWKDQLVEWIHGNIAANFPLTDETLRTICLLWKFDVIKIHKPRIPKDQREVDRGFTFPKTKPPVPQGDAGGVFE